MLDSQKKKIALSGLFGLLAIVLLTTLFIINGKKGEESGENQKSDDLTQILERGVLRATTNFNSTNYFVYRGEPMGFHLELLKLFANHLGVELQVYASNDLEDNFNCLLEDQQCDLIAMDLTVTRSRNNKIKYTEPVNQTRQVLVQRKPANWYSMRTSEMEDHLLRNQLDLAGKTVYVQKNSAFVTRLQNLMEEIGDTIYIVEADGLEMEQLIEKVAKGEIDYTVSDEHVALVNQSYYPNLDVQTPLSFPQNLAWAVRGDTPELLEVLNEWLAEFRKSRQYVSVYNKYYRNQKAAFIVKSEFNSINGGGISVFDDYIKTHSTRHNLDWRLVASIIYQESRFNPQAVSWAGAFGLMQLMPGTAERFEVDSTSTPSQNISAGVQYLVYLDRRLKKDIIDDEERLKFVLASYNAGLGHVLDARRLAVKYGKDPDVWKDNVDYFLLNKSQPEYYLDPVVQHGYCRGSEPYHYVYQILERYEHYKNAIKG